MAFLEGLLGGISGLTEAGGTALLEKKKREEKQEQDARDFQREVIKALAQTQMMGKGEFDWNAFTDKFGADLVDPSFIEVLKKGFRRQSQPMMTPGSSPFGPNPISGDVGGGGIDKQARLEELRRKKAEGMLR